MSSEQPVLGVGATGDAVRRLHALLRGAGYGVSADELMAGTFGASTRAAIEAFQRAHGLAPSGVADAATLNRLYSEETVRNAAPRPPTGAPAAAGPTPVGAPPVAASGAGPSSAAPAAPAAAGPVATGPFVAAPVAGPPPAPTRANIIDAQGDVTLADATPVPGVTVQLVAQGLRSLRPLARVATDDAGHFAVRLERQGLRGRGKLDDGLLAQALDAQGRTIAQSDPLFNIGQMARFRLLVSADTIRPPTEFERLYAAATSALDKGVTLASLNQPEIVFVARQIGFTAQQLSQLARAEQGQSQYGVPVALLYACGRQGLSAQAPRLASFPPDAIRAAVAKATMAARIPAMPATEVDAAIARLQQLNLSQSLSVRPTQQSASLTDLLTLAQIPAAAHQAIAAHADAQGLDTPASGRRSPLSGASPLIRWRGCGSRRRSPP